MTAATDLRLEGALRDVFAERDPGTAVPPALVDRLDASLGAVEGAADTARPRARRLRLGPALARGIGSGSWALGAAALVAAMVFLWRLSGPPVPGAGPIQAGDPSFDPALRTAGIVAEPEFVLPGWLPVAMVLVIPFVLGRRPAGRRIALAGLVAAASLGVLMLVDRQPLAFGGLYGPVTGLGDPVPGAALEPDRLDVLAGPGRPFAVGFSVRNAGPLPMRVEGFVDPLADVPGQGHWTGVWLQDVTDRLDPTTARPFAALALAPGEERVVILTGIAGGCALGRPSSDADAEVSLRIRAVTSVLGAQQAADLTGPTVDRPWFELRVPTRMGCAPAS